MHKHEFVTTINLKHSSSKALERILNFFYTSQITINLKSIDALLTCAHELGVKKIRELCENCVACFDYKKHVFEIIEISLKHNLKRAYFESLSFISKHIDKLIMQPEFLFISYHLKKKPQQENQNEQNETKNRCV